MRKREREIYGCADSLASLLSDKAKSCMRKMQGLILFGPFLRGKEEEMKSVMRIEANRTKIGNFKIFCTLKGCVRVIFIIYNIASTLVKLCKCTFRVD